MKRILALLLALTLTGCSAQTIPEEPTEPEKQQELEVATQEAEEPNPWGITLTAKDPRPNGVTIVCEQSGGMPSGELSTGSPYWLEVKEGEVWEDYPAKRDDIAWTMEGWGIPRNGAVEWLTNWEGLYGELPAGTYRIGKTIMDWRAPGDYDERACYAEFTIA